MATNKPIVRIHNIETNEVIEREMSGEELANIQANKNQMEAAEQALLDYAALKTSAKAKLIAGEPLTEAEANTLVI